MNKVEKLIETSNMLIDKMLEPYGVDHKYIVEHKKIKGKLWYQYYTWTTEEQKAFEEWATKLLRKRHRWSTKLCGDEVGWFILNLGLKTKDA